MEPTIQVINLIIKKAMNTKSKALGRSLTALEDSFPTLILPTQHASQSLFDYLETITCRLLPSKDRGTAIQRMKYASDAQQYRIQRSLIEIESQTSYSFLEEICYEAPTGIMAERELFSLKNEGDGSSMVDDIWWNAEKKMEEVEYFMD